MNFIDVSPTMYRRHYWLGSRVASIIYEHEERRMCIALDEISVEYISVIVNLVECMWI